MQCSNCGFELPDNLSFCTNCGAAIPVEMKAGSSAPNAYEKADLESLLNVTASEDEAMPASSGLGASLEAALQANQDEMDSIEARAQAQVDAAFGNYPPAETAQPVSSMGFDYDQGMGGWTDESNQPDVAQVGGAQPSPGVAGVAGAAAAGAAAAGAAYGASAAYGAGAPYGTNAAYGAGAPYGASAPQQNQVPFYQQDVSPNAHYSSQRSYDANAYGQTMGQQPYQAGYQQPSYGQPSAQPDPSGDAYRQPSYGQPAAQPGYWGTQTDTARAYAMVLYIAGLIGLIIGLCVRDKSDPFITHHLNNVLVIFIGSIIGSILSIFIIGFILLIYLFVMMIMGMVSAYNGDMRELPLIGKIHIIS